MAHHIDSVADLAADSTDLAVAAAADSTGQEEVDSTAAVGVDSTVEAVVGYT